MDSAPEFTTPTATEGEVIRKYLEVETEYMAAAGFFTHSRNALIRSHAVSIIATHSPTDDPDAFIPYLAMNYFDRYFSTVQFQDVQDMRSDSEKVCLIALCCFFISAKMRLKILSVDQFLRDKSINFTHERIMVMELKILDVLDWRMRPVTAFLYLNYYYRLFKSLGGFKRRCINEIIVQAQGENEFVCYKPSQIAMSAFLVAAKIAYPSNKLNYQEEEEELSECVKRLGDLCGRKNIKIEGGKSENLSTSSKIAVDSSEEVEDEHSSEEVEDETELPIRQTRDKGREVVLALEAGTDQGEAEEQPSDEQIATITDEIGNKTNPEEGSLESNIVEVTEEERLRLAKGKAVDTKELIDEIGNKTHHKRGKSYETELLIRCRGDPSYDELLTILIEKNDKKTHSAEGLWEWEQKVIEEDIVEITVEEKRRVAKGKATVVSETSNEEERTLAKGKAVAVSETSDEEKQPPESKLEKQKKKLDKEEQEIIAAIVAAIKLGMDIGKVDKGARVRGSSELQIVNEPEKLMNFDLKWATDVPPLEGNEALTVIVQAPPVILQGEGSGNANKKFGCAQCNIL